MGDRNCVVAREMTKIHEEFLRGRVSEVLKSLTARHQIKGECTVLVNGAGREKTSDWDEVQAAVHLGLADGEQRPADLAKAVADQFGISRKKAYDEILRQKKLMKNYEMKISL